MSALPLTPKQALEATSSPAQTSGSEPSKSVLEKLEQSMEAAAIGVLDRLVEPNPPGERLSQLPSEDERVSIQCLDPSCVSSEARDQSLEAQRSGAGPN